MKKTIITLVALAGVAFGADYTTEKVWTASFGSSYNNGYSTDLTSPGTFWDAGDVKTANGAQTTANKRIHMAGGNYGSWETNFQYTLNLTFTGNSIPAGHFSEIKAGSTGDWLCLGVDGSGALTLSGNVITAATSSTKVSLNTAYTITLTKIESSLILAVDGVDALSVAISGADGTINNIALGGNTGAGQRIPVLVESISWSTVTPVPVTPDGGEGTVPEPTTATLSLLALAGLAARRRRK